jgi:HK97 family phage prohead protease
MKHLDFPADCPSGECPVQPGGSVTDCTADDCPMAASKARRALPTRGAILTRHAYFEKQGSDGGRHMRFIASDESVDRYGDIIRAAGWQLDNFRKNPVLLFGHNSRETPVGQVDPIQVVGTQLVADCQFRPAGDSVLADDVWTAVDGGFLRAVSVGFAPTGPINQLVDQNGNWTGFEFTQQELLELSVVPVPANPQALAVARSLGISEATQRLMFAPDVRAAARAADEHRRRTINLLRLRGMP